MNPVDPKKLDEVLKIGEEHKMATMSELEFKTNLLPLLTSDDPEVDLTPWLDVAGSWQRDILVLDNGTNKPLFIVPALVGASSEPVKQNADNSAYELTENARREMLTMPRAGDLKLLNGLRQRIDATGDLNDARAKWNAIWERYGFTDRIVTEGVTPIGREAIQESTSSIQFDDYDEA